MCSLSIQSFAEQREYDSDTFEEKLIIPASSLQTVDLKFKKGEELEFIYALRVKQDLPIDIWFVNDENYNLFVGGGEFKFYIDGSQQQVIFTKNIVSVTEYDDYRLILANYNNQTIEVSVAYEIRIYKGDLSESSSENSFMSNLEYPLIITVIILAVIVTLLFFKTHKSKRDLELKNSEKISARKSKRREVKKEKAKSIPKPKKSPPKREASPSKNRKSRQKSKSKTTLDSTTFCGYCGKTVDTPYCKNCGHEI